MVLGLVWTSSGFADCVDGNCTNGKGTYTFPSGNEYVGEFKNGKPNGEGIFTYPNGGMHMGEYKNGKRNGLGT